MSKPLLLLSGLCVLGSGFAAAAGLAGPVDLVPRGDGRVLSVDGEPWPIKGVGGTTHFDRLAAAGGNAVRTWGVDEGTGDLLDEAHRHGLKVAVGLWLGHARHGFDYGDEAAVRKQFDDARAAVERYKDHPAVLMWGVGNEMEGFDATTDPRVWRAVNDIAAMIDEVDPDHPTMTVIAEIGGDKLPSIRRYCPAIDIVGINSYGGVTSIPERYAAAGLDQPYVVTEFGPPGTWEQPGNDWGVPTELTSTQKAAVYRDAYAALAADPNCLGSFAFLWGHKQEATATWFGLLLPGGEKLGGVDALTEAWGGGPPDNRAPEVEPIEVVGDPVVGPGGAVEVRLETSDADGDGLRVEWVLFREMDEFFSGGDFRPTPPTFPEAIQEGRLDGAAVRLPAGTGNYRLFAYVYDGVGGAAVANVPLRAEDASGRARGPAVPLPLTLYDEAGRPEPYVPSGYMGSTRAIRMEPASTRDPKFGNTCLEVTYAAPGGWGGVVWQSPADDWGEADGGYGLTGADTLRFWARGERGGEAVKFGFGLLGRDKAFYDTAKGEIAVTLTPDWRRYEVPLAGKDLSRIKTGFYWTLAGQGRPVTFFLDRIEYVAAAEPGE